MPKKWRPSDAVIFDFIVQWPSLGTHAQDLQRASQFCAMTKIESHRNYSTLNNELNRLQTVDDGWMDKG